MQMGILDYLPVCLDPPVEVLRFASEKTAPDFDQSRAIEIISESFGNCHSARHVDASGALNWLFDLFA